MLKVLIYLGALILVLYGSAILFGYSHEEILDYIYLVSLDMIEVVGGWIQSWFSGEADFSGVDDEVRRLMAN